MSTPKAHLQIYTGPPNPEDGRTFHPFPRLPVELRRAIWRMSLERTRMIDVHLEDAKTETGSTPDGARYSYRVHVGTRRVHSELLRVNRESRHAAGEFYRVRIPCIFLDNGIGAVRESGWKGHLAYNPEYDFLHITTRSLCLADFLHDLKTTYDPHHVGILNLATEQGTLVMLIYTLGLPDQVDTKVRETVGEVFSQLREVWFVSLSGAGRQLPRRTDIPIPRDIFNRSYPIMGRTATFERLRRDPREIAPDLDRVLMTTFHRHRTIQDWNEVLRMLGASPRHVSYRLLLASCQFTSSWPVTDRKSAYALLEKEEEIWADGSRGGREFDPLNDDLERVARPAVGFWLFNMDAMDALRRNREPWSEFCTLDLREYWPELAVLEL